jgi:hypothetical protein
LEDKMMEVRNVDDVVEEEVQVQVEDVEVVACLPQRLPIPLNGRCCHRCEIEGSTPVAALSSCGSKIS